MKMDCTTFTALLDDYLDAGLDRGGREAAEAHVATCGACRERLAAARRVQTALAAYPVAGPRDGFADRVLAEAARPRRRRGAPRLIAGGFVAAFAASILTVIYTGLLVEAPRTEIAAGLPMVSMTLDERRTVNLVFASTTALEDVSLRIDLPEGIELAGHAGSRQVRWQTELVPGRNVLPLELVALEPVSGQLVAELGHGEQRKVFRVFVSVMPG